MCVSAAHRQDPAVGRTQRVLPTFYRGERERVPQGGQGCCPKRPPFPRHKDPCQNYSHLTLQCHTNLAPYPTVSPACLAKQFPTNLLSQAAPPGLPSHPQQPPGGTRTAWSESQFKALVTAILTTALRGGCHCPPRRQTQAVTVSFNHTRLSSSRVLALPTTPSLQCNE